MMIATVLVVANSIYLICFLTIGTFGELSRNPTRSTEGQPSQLQCMNRQVLKQMIEQHFPEVSCDEPGPVDYVCAVCLDRENISLGRRILQCHHSFHASCIDAWWLSNACLPLKCPLCRTEQSVMLLPGWCT